MGKRTQFIPAAAGVAALLALGYWMASAQQPSQKPPTEKTTAVVSERAPEEDAIRRQAEAFSKAFEAGDAKAVASLWTDEGEYVNDDAEPIRGRPALEKGFAEFFSKRPHLKAEKKIGGIRFVGRDTAVEEGVFTVRGEDGPAVSSKYSVLFVRQDGKWLMSIVKEWNKDPAGGGTVADLEWLIGSWVADGPASTVRTTYEWLENKKFIKAHFAITNKEDGKTASTGTEIIGVDPATGGIRAWVFESDGGVGEFNWKWDGEKWAIDASGTLADGSELNATNFIRKTGPQSFTWQSVKRSLNGEAMPDVGPLKVTKSK